MLHKWTDRPLPDETKARSAKDLIARFQSSINTTESAEVSARPRQSLGLVEGSRDGLSPSPGANREGLEAGSSRSSRLTPSPGLMESRLSPSDNESTTALNTRHDLAKSVTSMVPMDDAKSEGTKAAEHNNLFSASEDTSANRVSEKEPSTSLSNSNGVSGQKQILSSIRAKAASPNSISSAAPERSSTAPPAIEKDLPGRTDLTNIPNANSPREGSVSANSVVKDSIPHAKNKSSAESAKHAATASPSTNAPNQSPDRMQTRRVVTTNSSIATKEGPRRLGHQTLSSPPTKSHLTVNSTTMASPSTSTSRLMQPTAASRARSSIGGLKGMPEASRSKSSVVTASSPRDFSAITANNPRASSSISGASSKAGADTAQNRGLFSPVAKAHVSPGKGTKSPIASKVENPLSAAQSERLATAEQSDVHQGSRDSRIASSGSQSEPGGSAFRGKVTSRPRSSVAMARESSHETPTKGARSPFATTPGKAKVAITPPSFSSEVSGKMLSFARRATPASASSEDASHTTKPSFVHSSSSTSRLTRPTASSLAHTRTAESLDTPLSASAHSTPSSSVKATIGSHLPFVRAQVSPLANMRPGPKIGIVKGPLKVEAKGKKRDETQEAEKGGRLSPLANPAAMIDERRADEHEHEDSKPTDDVIPDIPSEPEVETDKPILPAAAVSNPLTEQIKRTQPSTVSKDKGSLASVEPASNGSTENRGAITSQALASDPQDTNSKNHEGMQPGSELSEPDPQRNASPADGEKVFTGFGSDRPFGKIGTPTITSTAPDSTELGLSDKWGTRDGGNLRSPSPRSVILSPAGSMDSQREQKSPIWMRKGGV